MSQEIIYNRNGSRENNYSELMPQVKSLLVVHYQNLRL